tara:strand:+ start:67 stop:768 length:702 start_codon:yes stop_codon:yes gene_type:complete
MKIAFCLSGYTGAVSRIPNATVENNTSSEGYKKQLSTLKSLDLDVAYELFQKNVIQDYDVDTFIHSWSVDKKDDILKKYKPKDYIIEPQRGKEDGILDNIYSVWYSRKKVLELAFNSKVKYDWFLLTRFDLGFYFPLLFDTYDNRNVILAGEGRSIEVNDVYFLTNRENMKVISKMFDSLKNFGYRTDSKHGSHPGGVHHTVGLYIRRNCSGELVYEGSDRGGNPTIKLIRTT